MPLKISMIAVGSQLRLYSFTFHQLASHKPVTEVGLSQVWMQYSKEFPVSQLQGPINKMAQGPKGNCLCGEVNTSLNISCKDLRVLGRIPAKEVKI